MGFELPKKFPPKELKSIRLSVKASKILDQLAQTYKSNPSLIIEGLINTFGPGAIEEGQKIGSQPGNGVKK